MFDTPILFLVFNRVETASRVFNRIKELKPKKLYISADGPREGVIGESDKCRKVRELFNQIDWEASWQ